MHTHKHSPFLQWLKEERLPLLWSTLAASLVVLVSMSVSAYRAQVIGQWKRVNVPAMQFVGHVMTSQERRQLIRMKRIARRLAARQKLVRQTSSQMPLRAGPAPVESSRTVAQSAVTDITQVTPSEESSASSEESSSSTASSVTPPPQPSPTFAEATAGRPGAEACVPFINAIFPVSKIPNWGAMRSPDVWNLDYAHMPADEYVPVPRFDIKQLTIPRKTLIGPPIPDENIPTLTAKLFYSTRFFAAYDIDSAEFTAVHPGVDLKLPLGTPVGAIAGGVVTYASTDERLGLHVIVRHCASDGIYYSIYGHFGSVAVHKGQTVTPGETVGYVGMTGKANGPHVHLQVDIGDENDDGVHEPYYPDHVPSRSEADRYTVHPVQFIATHR